MQPKKVKAAPIKAHSAAFAASRALPLLIVHAGPEERVWKSARYGLRRC